MPTKSRKKMQKAAANFTSRFYDQVVQKLKRAMIIMSANITILTIDHNNNY